jgi:putative ABC transport system permease protein
MHLLTLQRRSLVHHWRSHAAVLLGVIVGTAVLTGALLVGDSLRGSLRAAALDRLGGVAYAVQSLGFFREQLAADLAAPPGFRGAFTPIILLRGTASNADTHASATGIHVLGVDDRFGANGPSINAALAEDIGIRPSEDVLIRLAKPTAQSSETLFGQRDETTLTLRLTVQNIIPASGRGVFSLVHSQTTPRNVYVPLATLQRALGRAERVNTVLITPLNPAGDDTPLLQSLCQFRATLADVGLKLRTSATHDYVSLESEAFLLAPPVESAGRAAANALYCAPTEILTYLANTIGYRSSRRRGEMEMVGIPYSTVTAWQPGTASEPMTLVDGSPAPPLAAGEILLNEWAANELHRGIELSYYVTDAPGQLNTEYAGFQRRGVVRIAGAADDPGLTPEYPGLTDARSLADWRPPFPINLRRIRPQDEAYWEEHKATPKAFISLADGQRIWARDPERFGRLTAMRVYPASLRDRFESELHARLDIAQLGLHVDAVRARALAAGAGTTDFGGLFLGFSLFLIASAAMLVGLLFKLGIERRGHEVGLLLAIGFSRARVWRLLIAEAAVVALCGAGAGVLGACCYAALLLVILRHWWGSTFAAGLLHFHATATSCLVGGGVSLLIAIFAMLWALRSTVRATPRALLARIGPGSSAPPSRQTSRRTIALACFAGLIGLVSPGLTLATSRVGSLATFFIAGSSFLVAGLAGLAYWLQVERGASIHPSGACAWLRLGVRNARRAAGRSLLTVGLIACATFVIAALQAFRVDVGHDTALREAGTGGFELMAESDVPLLNDPNASRYQANLTLPDAAQRGLADVRVVAFRVHDGDEASCLNLYQPTQPRILGVPEFMARRGGFAFAGSLARTDQERRHPWTLLRAASAEGVIPAIADEAAARWQLHLNLGDELQITDERGRAVRLRLVALLQGSVLQGEVLIAESAFTRLFPSTTGYRFFLIDAPPDRVTEVARTLSSELSDYGLAVTPTTRRLEELLGVQNVYLAAFQTLGGLGLLLGTAGLAAVMLRNVWERRGELALLRALGFSRGALVGVVLIENMFLVGTGLLIGLACAALVDAPHILARATPVPWASLVLLFAVVFLAGLSAGLAALLSALRAPLLPALRSE